MEQLTGQQADLLAYKYNFLKAFTVGGFRVNEVLKQAHEQNDKAFMVVVVIEKSDFGDRLENLDEFCNKHHIPYPVLDL